MNRIALLFSFFALIFSAGMPTQASANGESLRGIEADFPFPGRPDANNQRDLIVRQLNQKFQGKNTLALRQILDLDQSYRGRKVEFVVLQAYTTFGQGHATLVMNGRDMDRQQVGNRMSMYRFNLGRGNNVIGDDIRTLQIDLQGQFHVASVGVKLAEERMPGRDVERITIQRNFQGINRIELARLVNLAQYRGMRLQAVVLSASTAAGHGTAAFCSQGCSPAQTVGTRLDNYVFRTNELVDRFANNWIIDLRGGFWVDSITLRFAR